MEFGTQEKSNKKPTKMLLYSFLLNAGRILRVRFSPQFDVFLDKTLKNIGGAKRKVREVSDFSLILLLVLVLHWCSLPSAAEH